MTAPKALYSHFRTGEKQEHDDFRPERLVFQRDYDRLIFSSAFRRLQGKTQVFPLPRASVFVHNRLTHSLEVASLGRSLGNLAGVFIAKNLPDLSTEDEAFYNFQLGSVISAACLAHDIGNPPFGHSGESAISAFFKKHKNEVLSGLTETEQADFLNFEGNANALRILTSGYHHRKPGGLGLTYSTLAAILKYPCAAIDSAGSKGPLSTKKYGYFLSEIETARAIAKETGMHPATGNTQPGWKRHPFVFLTEAADDICYRIIDLEDAHRLHILSTADAEHILKSLLFSMDGLELNGEVAINFPGIEKRLATLTQTDPNERIGYLRAKAIHGLIYACAAQFQAYFQPILAGQHEHALLDTVPQQMQSVLNDIEKYSVAKIYNHRSVVEIEIAGYKVLGGLLEEFVPAILDTNPDKYHKKLFDLMPAQFRFSKGEMVTPYQKLQSAVDFVSGMTDNFALDLFRKLKGINLT